MSRYIDAEALVKYANNQKDKTVDANDIMRFPTADVVKVVRCKDCNNADYAGCPKGSCYCMEHGAYFGSNDYCSYGERREKDHE